MEKAQAERQKGLKKKITRVFQRSKSSEEKDRKESKGPGSPLDPQAASSRRIWGSWRQKKSPEPWAQSMPSTPLLTGGEGRLFPTSSFTSLQTNDCNQAEQVTQDFKVVCNYDQVADPVQNTALGPQSPRSPTGKSNKFQNIRFSNSGKAEEGKRNQVLDYLGGIFGSGRKKTSKTSPAVPLSPSNSVEESPLATKDLSSSEQNSPSNIQDIGFSQDNRSEEPIEAEAPDQNLLEISPGSSDVSCLLPASSDPGTQTVSSPETKNVTIIDISLQKFNREPEPNTVSERVGEQLSPEVVHGNPTKELLSDVSSTLINKDTSLTSGCTGTSLPSDDRTVKEREITQNNNTSVDENKSQETQQQKDNKFVNRNRLTEAHYDCETDKCVDIPAIKECVLPVSETVRIEQIARVAEIDVHPPKSKVYSNVKLSEAAVSLPINSIGVEVKALEKPLKNEEIKQLNYYAFQGFKKESVNHTIPEKTSFTCDLAKQQRSTKNDQLVPDTSKSKVEEEVTTCITHIGEDTSNLLKVDQHPTDNPSGDNLNGLVESESNTDKAVTNSHTDVGNSKNAVEKLDLFLGLKSDLNSTTLGSFEMDKKSPSEGKRGGRKGRRRRSLKSDQSGRNTDPNTIEETVKENDSNVNEVKLSQQSTEVPVKMPPSPKQSHSKTLPESVLFTEKPAQGVSKPFASRKKSSQRASYSATPDNEIESPVKGSPEKSSNAETQSGGSETLISTHSVQIPGQKVKSSICESSEGAVGGSPNNEAFNVSLQGAITDKLCENTIILDFANQSSDVEAVSRISNQQSLGKFDVNHSVITQEPGADSEIQKTVKINNLKGKSINKNVITSQLHSTVTIRIPSSEKEGESNAQTNPSNQLKSCTEIRTEEEETIRITLPKKKNATSHHQVDFFTTKDLPLASNSNKTCVGSLKIQIQNKPARRADGTLTVIGKRQPNTLKNVEAAAGVNVAMRHKTDEISQVKADDTEHIFAEVLSNEGMKPASVHVENTSSKIFADTDAGKSEENCSIETVSPTLSGHSDVKSQSSSVDTQTSEICLSEIEKDVTSKNIKEQEEHLNTAACPLVPAVPLIGAELQSREMEGKVTLLPSVQASENKKEASAKKVNGNKAIKAEANPELGQQNIPKVENQAIAVKDTVLSQNVEEPTTVLSDKDKNANKDLNQRERSSDVIVQTIISTQQSPPQSQPTEDIALPQGLQVTETMSKIEEKSIATGDNEKPTDAGITVGKLAQQSSPVLKISDCKAKSSSSQSKQMFESTESEIKTDTNASCVIEQQDCLDSSSAEGAVTEELSSLQTQPGKTAIEDRSPQCVEMSEMQNEAHANCFIGQKSDKDVLTTDSALTLQMNSKEINDTPHVCDQVTKIVTDTSANVVCDTESGSNEVTLGFTLPLPQVTPTLQNDGSEIRETKSFQNTQAFGTMEAEISKEELVERSNEQSNDCKAKNASPEPIQTFKITASEMENGMNSNSVIEHQESLERATIDGDLPVELDASQKNQRENEKKNRSPHIVEVSNMLTSADLELPIKQGAVEVNDASVCLQTSTIVPVIEKDVPVSGGSDTEFGSTETKGGPVQPLEQNLSVLGNRSSDINETASSQSLQLSGTAESNLNEGSSTTVSSDQNGSSEVTTSKFGLPLLSSTPKVQHQQMEPKSVTPALTLGPSTGNLSRAKISLETGSIEQRTEPGAPTNENSLYVQNTEESQPSKVVIKEAFVIDDTYTNEAIIDLDSTANVIPTAIEPTASKSQQESERNVSLNEGNSLDSSSDMDSFTETIRRYGNPIHLPQKKQRVPKMPPTPPFAMPPIQEDQMSPKKEKNFEPNSFKLGLMKCRVRKGDTPSSLLKMQQIETKSKVVKRVSAEQSLLFKSLSSKKPLFQKRDHMHDDLASATNSKRSRFETGKTLGQISTLSTEPTVKSTDLSPSLLKNDVDDGFEFDSSDPTSSETQLPDNTEKCLKSSTSEDESNSVVSVSEKHLENGLTIPNLKPNLLEINMNFADITDTNALVSESPFQRLDCLLGDQNLPSLFSTDLSTPKSLLPYQPEVGTPEKENVRLNSRPGKIIIYSQPRLGGEAFEFFHDVQDATYLKLPSEISVKVVRGCWLLYENPNFEGGKVALEEGVVELADIWGKKMGEDSSDNLSPSTSNECSVGSIRRIVKEWCLPEIDLCTELDGLGRKTTYFDEMEEIQMFGILEPTLSLEVFSGTWLLFEEPFYQGNSYIVEVGQYPHPESWEATDPYIGSLKPLKMGVLKVEKLHDRKVIIYEKPFFEGKQLEIKTDVFSFTGEDEISALCYTYPFENVGSMKVLGGFWVGYEKPGFRGHQYALEEGEYQAWNEWGGYNEHLQSLRFIQVDLSNPVMVMYNEANFCEKSGNIEILGPVPILEEADHGLKPKSINVLSGTWVAYENSDFTGEQYVLEKGLYSTFEDWGATNCTIASVQPVLVDAVESDLSKFKVKLFSEPEFQGSVQVFDMDAVQFPDSFSPKSCEVVSGSWVTYDAENFTGNQYVLEEGSYSDLAAVGCATDSCIKSVKTVNFCFTMPSIILFTREKFEGKRVELTSEVLNLKLEGYDTHIFSVIVNGGIWVAYECSNYRGRQILLQPSQIPNWHQHTGWHRIGSLRPLIQRRVYFRVRNRATGAFLTLTGELNDTKMVRVQALEDTGMDDQIWFYQDGYITSKMAEDCCLDVIGSLLGPGSRLGISVLHSKDIHIWGISSDGVIWSNVRTELVIDVKGGQVYDKNQTILSKYDEVRPTQRWDLDIL